MLTDEELRRFGEDGYLVCRDRYGRDHMDALCTRLSGVIAGVASEYVEGRRSEWNPWRLLDRSRYGLEVLWDTSARSPMGLPPSSWEPFAMRVGHALHRHDAAFGKVATNSFVSDGLRQLIGEPARVVQSAVIYKQPRSQVVQFGWHQDASYITLEAESLVLAFVALDDMDAENGTLKVCRGRHRDGLYEPLRMGPNGWLPAGPQRRFVPSDEQVLSLEKGAVVFVHGRCFHASDPNASDRPRRSYIVHAAGSSTFARESWLQEDPAGFVPLEPRASSDEDQLQ